MSRTDTIGIVYLLHFDRPFHHAKHYTGWCVSHGLLGRLRVHERGKGSRLVRAVLAAGIGYKVAKTWENVPRSFERSLKKRGGASRHCPICKGGNGNGTG